MRSIIAVIRIPVIHAVASMIRLSIFSKAALFRSCHGLDAPCRSKSVISRAQNKLLKEPTFRPLSGFSGISSAALAYKVHLSYPVIMTHGCLRYESHAYLVQRRRSLRRWNEGERLPDPRQPLKPALELSFPFYNPSAC